MKSTLLALALVLTPALAAADTKADTSLTVELDLTESEPKKDDEVLTFTLSLAGDHGCASAESSSAVATYEVKVCREGGDASAPVLTFEVQRDERVKDKASHRRLRVASKLATGKRTVVGKIARGTADATEIAATIK